MARTILFGWELGANLGHLMPIAGIAAAIEADKYEMVFALRDLAQAEQLLGNTGRILQAPIWPHHRHFGARGELASFADILVASGFGDPVKLSAMFRAWTALIDLVRPDLVIADGSPGLQVALFGSDLPIIAIGSAFMMPPLEHGRLPLLRGDRTPVMPESRILDSVSQVLAARNRPKPSNLGDVFRTGHRVIFGLPELDPYRSFRSELIAMPPGGLPSPQPWPDERRLFVYVGAECPNLEILAQALVSLKVPVELYLRGDVGPLPAFLRMRGMTVHEKPPPLAEVLPRASHIVSHGGAMTSAAAFTAGRPQLVISVQDESRINLSILSMLGVAHGLQISESATDVAAAIGEFLSDTNLPENALEHAHRIAGRVLPDGALLARDAIRQVLA